MSTEKLTLADGKLMPIIGLGTWQITDEKEIKDSLSSALDCGYRHIDTAWMYRNESFINEVLSEYFSSKELARSDLFVTTKLALHFMGTSDLVRQGIEGSFKNLGLDYIDLYIIHFPTAVKYEEHMRFHMKLEFIHDTSCITNAWKIMEEYVDQGKLKSIGVSNFNIEQLQRIKEIKRHPIACNQVECHVFFQQPELYEYCQKENIKIVAYATLGSPVRPYKVNWNTHAPMQEPVVKGIADKYQKTAAQVLLRFLIQRKICVIPKSIKPSRVRENFDVFDFNLSEEDMKALVALDKNERTFHFSFIKNHEEYPFN